MNINEIATAAHGLKKIGKPELFGMVRALIASDAPVDRKAAIALYNYFTPPMPKVAKTATDWVMKALADVSDVRYHLQSAHSDGKYLTATCGHRIHRIPTTLEPGYYDRNLIKVDIDARYPDTDQFYSERGNEQEIQVFVNNLDIVEIAARIRAYLIPVSGDMVIGVNTQYLDKARNGVNDILLTVLDETSPIRMDTEFGTAVIMPLRLPKGV